MFTAAEQRADKVIKSAKEHVYLQPFKDIMTEFFEKGKSAKVKEIDSSQKSSFWSTVNC